MGFFRGGMWTGQGRAGRPPPPATVPAMDSAAVPVTAQSEPSLLDIGWAMLGLGVISFGGNNALLMSDVMVNKRRWLDQEEMDDAIAVATLGPGGNSSNLSYEVGRRLRGVAGGVMAYVAMALPGILLVVTIGTWILSVDANRFVAGAMNGAEAAVVAMIAAVGFRLGKKSLRSPLDWTLAVAMFVLAGPLGVPLLLTLPPAAAIGYLLKSKGWAK